MSGTKFTPGPWKTFGGEHVYSSGPTGGNVCSVSDPRSSKSVRYVELDLGSPDAEEAYANANLISAAPDMYAALCNSLCPRPANTRPDGETVASCIESAHSRRCYRCQAIARARGEKEGQ